MAPRTTTKCTFSTTLSILRVKNWRIPLEGKLLSGIFLCLCSSRDLRVGNGLREWCNQRHGESSGRDGNAFTARSLVHGNVVIQNNSFRESDVAPYLGSGNFKLNNKLASDRIQAFFRDRQAPFG